MSNVIDIRTRAPWSGSRRQPTITVNSGPDEYLVHICFFAGPGITNRFPTYEKAIWYARGCAAQQGYSLTDLVGSPQGAA